ncbi:MAG: hypothetical protein JWM71_764 [Solirubrobacteraceae bacterium]|nr:hypothetical protein [Solirubrobacteraceae bacterium]
MPGRGWGSDSTVGERRTAALALVLLAAIVVVDTLSKRTVLVSLLVIVPLISALACSPRTVSVIGGLTLAAGIALGAIDHVFANERHFVGLTGILVGGLVSVAAARTRTTLAGLHVAGDGAYRRIALLDRASGLFATPMEFQARLKELSRLPLPDIGDLCMIDLATDDGRLDGIVVSATDPAQCELVEAARERSPIDLAGEHPVAVALRTGQAQLRSAMSTDELARYSASPDHLDVMTSLAYRSAVVIPLVAPGRIMGVLSVLRLGLDAVPFDEADLSLLTDLASRAALAVDNARLYEDRLAAETRLQTVLDGLAEAVIMVSAEGDLAYVNDAGAALFGFAHASELPALRISEVHDGYELFDEAGRPFDVEHLPGRRVLRGEPAEPVTYRRRHIETGEDQWLTVKASAVHDLGSGLPALAVNVIENVTAERRAREATDFLSEASKVLASSLEFEGTLERVANAAVPQIADWCSVELLEPDGTLRPVALAHVEPEKAPVAAELRERYPVDPKAPAGVPQVVRSGVSELYAEIDPVQLEEAAEDPRHLELMRALQITSVLIVPMTAGDRTIGAITFVTTQGRRRLSDADRELAEELGRRAGVSVEHARVHRERSHVAATLQRSLLPPRLPVVPGLTLAARFRAAGEANQVGGDFYDLFPVEDGWIVVIGDVTGKGPDAAAITSLARYTIRTAAIYERDPVGIMRRLNEALLAGDEHRQMCTAVCLKIMPAGGGGPIAVRMVCAGHPPPFLLRAPSTLVELCRPGPLLGAFSEARWQAAEIELFAGDSIVLYTDGVTDARGAAGRFGQDRLEEVLRGAMNREADEIAEVLDERLLNFQEGPQRDDVALLVLRAAGTPDAPESTLIAGSATTQA